MIRVTDNCAIAMAMYAQHKCEAGIAAPPTTSLELETMWDDCQSQQLWLDRATMVRTFFRLSQRRGG